MKGKGLFYSLLLYAFVSGGFAGSNSESLALPVPVKSGEQTVIGANADWISRARQDIEAQEYHASNNGKGLQAPNRKHNLRTYFDHKGIRIVDRTSPDDQQLVSISFHSLSRGKTVIKNAQIKPQIISNGNRVEIRRAGITEWYVNTPAGLEQGFDIDRKPEGEGSLSLALKVESADAVLDGSTINLITSSGRNLRYGHLKVVDAAGRTIHSEFSMQDKNTIEIVVDDSKAVYPITVDPLITESSWSVTGDQANSLFGFSISAAGDVNNDGFDDVIIGAPGYDNGAGDEGCAFVYYGTSSSLPLTDSWSACGTQAGEQFGYSVSTAGNVNPGQYDDVIIGAPYYDNGQENEGRVAIYRGSSTGLLTTPSWEEEGNMSEALFGTSVSTAGDMNADGYSDIVIGAPGYSDGETGEGKIFVYFGSMSGIVSGGPHYYQVNIANASFGYSVSTAGDVNNDGCSDIIAGAPNEGSGKVYVFYGSDGGGGGRPRCNPPPEVWSAGEGGSFGFSVSTAGDVNGDGFSDIIVGSPKITFREYIPYFGWLYNVYGRATVFMGSASGVTLNNKWTSQPPEIATAEYGYSVASAGDFNGDGFDDIIIGAPLYDLRGGAFIFTGSGSGLGTTAFMTMKGILAGDAFGQVVSGVGHIYSDDLSDVAVGTPDLDKVDLFSLVRDVQVDELTFNFSHNLGYLVGETVTADLVLKTSVDEFETPVSYNAKIELVSGTLNLDDNTYRVRSEFNLGQDGEISVDASQVGKRGVFPSPGKSLHLQLSGRQDPVTGKSFEQWAVDEQNLCSIACNIYLAYRVTIDSSEEIWEGENGEGNNSFISNTFTLLPLTGNIRFGGITAVSDNVIIGDRPYGNILVVIESGNAIWDHGPNSEWMPMDIPLAGTTARFNANNDNSGFDLDVSFVNNGSTEGNLGGLHAYVTGSFHWNGFMPHNLTIELPEDHSYHLADSAGVPIKNGLNKIEFSEFEQTYRVNELNDLWAAKAGGYIHARGLPFSLGLVDIKIDKDSLFGNFNKIQYVYDLTYSSGDTRNVRNPEEYNSWKKGAVTNNRHFAFPDAPQSGRFSINSNGLEVSSIGFLGGNGKTHFPRTDMSWQSFTVSITGGHLDDGQTFSSENRYAFSMTADCGGCDSGPSGMDYTLITPDGGKPGLGRDGGVTGRVKDSYYFDGIGDNPAWGPWHEASGKHIFQRYYDGSNKMGVIFLPGFEAMGTGGYLNSDQDPVPVARYLMGTRAVRQESGALIPETHYNLGSDESRRGDYFMAGVNLGPELYSSMPVFQSSDDGNNLSDTRTYIGFGGVENPVFRLIYSNEGTKYVLRPGGITGVFNTNNVPDPKPIVYGYELDLRRFGFRVLNNVMDEHTWIDGSISLPGRAGFTVSFSSLGLECSGNLGGGIVDRELCNGQDDNDNDLVDENCGQQLQAWKAPMKPIQSIGFKPQSQAGEICAENAERLLSIGSLIEIAALDDLVGLTIDWNSFGDPVPDPVTWDIDQQHVVDRPDSPAVLGEDRGFTYSMKSIRMAHDINVNGRGWFEFSGDVAAPFWGWMPTDSVLWNESSTLQGPNRIAQQGQSILVKGGSLADCSPSSVLNIDMSEQCFRPRAEYSWGGTGFGLNLPVYYESRRQSKDLQPRFIGKPETADLVVLEISQAADFITPEKTKISFGASADIAELKALNPASYFDLNINLDDPDSITNIDTYLNNLGIDGSPIHSTIGGINGKLNSINSAVGKSLDGLIEKAVREAIESAVVGDDSFNALSASLKKVRGLPAEIANEIADELNELTSKMTLTLSADLDADMQHIHATLPDLLVQVNSLLPASTYPTEIEQGLKDAESMLNNASEKLGQVNDVIGKAQSAVDDAEDAVNFIKDKTLNPDFEYTLHVLRDLDRAISFLDNLDILTCDKNGNGLTSDENSDGIFARIEAVESEIGGLAYDLQEGGGLRSFSGSVSGLAGLNMRGVDIAQGEISSDAGDLTGVIPGTGALLSSIGCNTGDRQKIIGYAIKYLGDIKVHIEGTIETDPPLPSLEAVVGDMATALIESGFFGDIRTALEDAGGMAGGLKEAVDELHTVVKKALDFTSDEFFSSGSAGVIISKMDRLITDGSISSYSWCYGANCEYTFIAEMSTNVQEPVYTSVAAAVGYIETSLAPMMSKVPDLSRKALVNTVVNQIMNSSVIEDIDQAFFNLYSKTEIIETLNDLGDRVFVQVNNAVKEIINSTDNVLSKALEDSRGKLKGFPVAAGRLNGYADIVGDELERLHVDASWELGSSAKDAVSFGAALDIKGYPQDKKARECVGGSGSTPLKAMIRAEGLDFSIGESDIIIKELMLGFTLDQLTPIGVFGGIETEGIMDFEAFQLFDVGFQSGIGEKENYFGAKASGFFLPDTMMNVAFLLGRTCGSDVLTALDPQAGEFITLPDGVFEGVYVRGAGEVPVIAGGCALTLGVGADAGIWFLAGSSNNIGGIVGGSAFGRAACLASIRGVVTTLGQYVGDEFSFMGEGFGVAGAGFDCDRGTWTDVRRSRRDKWCGTCDVEATLTYIDGWDIEGTPIPSCTH